MPELKRCVGCGYILNGLPEPRCPECGRPFNFEYPCSYEGEVRSGRTLRRFALPAAAIVGYTAISIAQVPDWLPCLTILAVPAFILTIVGVTASLGALRGPRDLIRDRQDYKLTLLVCAVALAMLTVAAVFRVLRTI